MEVKFHELSPGDRVRVTGFDDAAKAYTSRLLSMGVTPGVDIEFVKSAPMGDPVEIIVRGYSLSLRKAEAEIVKLRRA